MEESPYFHLAQITNRCNLNCSFCKERWCPNCIKFDNNRRELSVDHWINRLKALERQNLMITGGEATLYPKLDEVIAYAKGLRVFVVTNGLNVPEYLEKENVMVNLFPSTIKEPYFDRIRENLINLKIHILTALGWEMR